MFQSKGCCFRGTYLQRLKGRVYKLRLAILKFLINFLFRKLVYTCILMCVRACLGMQTNMFRHVFCLSVSCYF